MKNSLNNIKKGFSLIEVLIVTSILGMISMAVLATFSSGLRVYERIQSFGHKQIDLLLALERMERDIRSTFYYGDDLSFSGTSKELSFAGINLTYDKDGREITSLGKFYYHFDIFKKVFEVDWMPFNNVENGYSQDLGFHENLVGIEDIDLKYYFCEDKCSEGEWLDEWNDKTKLPRGVEINIVALDGEKKINLTRKVFIPASNMVIEDEKKDSEETSPNV